MAMTRPSPEAPGFEPGSRLAHSAFIWPIMAVLPAKLPVAMTTPLFALMRTGFFF